LSNFRHPRANRQAHLLDAVVAYEFKRGKRCSIGFSVGPEGLVVRAPQWVALRDVDAAVQEKSHWIIKKLTQTRERFERLAAHHIEWCDGCVIPFFGEPMKVVLDPHRSPGPLGAEIKILALDADGASSNAPYLNLHLGLALNAAPEQIRDAVKTWLQRQARRHFTQRLDHFALQLKVRWQKLALSNAATRWGSARIDGSIRLNWRLMHFKQAVIDYVVVHELSHLRVMDHSPLFWSTVRAVVPDYLTLRAQLKEAAVPRWT
jgi:predicted metal-dependent hydrolase